MSGKFRPARKVERSGRCLNRGLGEIERPVKIPVTRSRTKRPRAALLQLVVGCVIRLCRIGGSLGAVGVSERGGVGEIPP